MVIFLASVGLFASEIRPSWGASPIGAFEQGPNDTVRANGSVSISNPGAYAIDSLSIATLVRFPGANGTVLALGGAPTQRVAGGATTVVPIVFTLPLSAGVDEPLLTEDLVLPSETWVNLTYATLFPLRLTLAENLSWGAPFDDLTVTPGPPQPQANGTFAVPVAVSFTDGASFPIDGALALTVNDPSGVECGQGSVGLDVASHASFQASPVTSVGPACEAAGSTLDLAFRSGPWTIDLPPEGFP